MITNHREMRELIIYPLMDALWRQSCTGIQELISRTVHGSLADDDNQI